MLSEAWGPFLTESTAHQPARSPPPEGVLADWVRQWKNRWSFSKESVHRCGGLVGPPGVPTVERTQMKVRERESPGLRWLLRLKREKRHLGELGESVRVMRQKGETQWVLVFRCAEDTVLTGPQDERRAWRASPLPALHWPPPPRTTHLCLQVLLSNQPLQPSTKLWRTERTVYIPTRC